MNQAYSRIKLQGLDPDMLYENILNKTENYGDELMRFTVNGHRMKRLRWKLHLVHLLLEREVFAE